MSATPQQIYHSALDQAWRKNVHILNKINKLELLGVIDMYEFEFSRTLEAQATEMLDRKTLWNKAYERDRTQQNTPKRFYELSKFYEKYCDIAESDGKTVESIGDLIVLLAQQCGKLSKAQKSLCDVVIPSDRLDFYMVRCLRCSFSIPHTPNILICFSVLFR